MPFPSSPSAAAAAAAARPLHRSPSRLRVAVQAYCVLLAFSASVTYQLIVSIFVAGIL